MSHNVDYIARLNSDISQVQTTHKTNYADCSLCTKKTIPNTASVKVKVHDARAIASHNAMLSRVAHMRSEILKYTK